MARFLSTEPVVLNLPIAIEKLPERGSMIPARSALSSPGGGYLGMVAVANMGVVTGMLSMLGTGPNSYMIRKDLEGNGVQVLTSEVMGDIGVSIQLVEDEGDNTVIVSAGVESDLQLDQIEQIELEDGDVLLVHGSVISGGEAGQRFASWVNSIDPKVKVVLAPSPMIDTIESHLWEPMLQRADVLTMNLREAGLLPRILKQADPSRMLEDYLKPDCVQVTRMGSLGCQYREGVAGQLKQVPAYATQSVDTSGVGNVHIAVMCGALVRGQDMHRALSMANAAGAVMVSHAYAFPVPTMREIADVMTFGGDNGGESS
ncbi:PfkB family carbohydrate kinase [Actinomyces urinae]|uniref:PfkB family carbohydrate kinase n=1 Tax=Actinomyces urinae TaxID=1689268 RepID=UPI000931294C|nr:PfkB family carbohydrate kinase [Actinomyces urinae]